MNIYVTNECPILSAKYLDDQSIKEMVQQTATILACVLRSYGDQFPHYKTLTPKDPTIMWTRSSRANYNWLVAHFEALCEEMDQRFDEEVRERKLVPYLKEKRVLIPDLPQTPFLNLTETPNMQDVFLAYRAQLTLKWLCYFEPATWYNQPDAISANQELYDEEKESAA